MRKFGGIMANRKKTGIFILSLLLCVVLAACSLLPSGTASNKGPARTDGRLQIYYLDVGQADCELIRFPDGKNALIDAGKTNTAEELVEYLQDMGVERIDYLIATHPHEDHIGGMAEVVKNLDIGKIYMPRVADSQTPTTKCYERLLEAISDKGLKMTAAKGGMNITEGQGLSFDILSPNREKYEDLNNYSVVTRLTYGEHSFLFEGDAESQVEKELLSSGTDVQADVLKCGHHGSNTSNTAAYLKAVRPVYAVISCGEDNDYGHPHQEVFQRLKKAGIEIFRTDQQGTVLAESDGMELTMQSGLASVK